MYRLGNSPKERQPERGLLLHAICPRPPLHCTRRREMGKGGLLVPLSGKAARTAEEHERW